MLRRRLTCFLPVALVACSGAPPALTPRTSEPRAERPAMKVGDRWTSARTMSTKKADAFTAITTVDATAIEDNVIGKPLLLTPDGNELEGPRWSHRPAVQLYRFALEVGKTWRGIDEWTDQENTDEGFEKVRVTAAG